MVVAIPRVVMAAQNRTQSLSMERRGLCRLQYAELVELVEDLQTPVTLDRVVDGVVDHRSRADHPPVSWHDLHEDLYLFDIPALDAAEELEFDSTRGLVDSAGS